MAYRATVTVHNDKGEVPHAICYGRIPAKPDTAEYYTHRAAHRPMERLRNDVLSLRRRAIRYIDKSGRRRL